MYSAEKICITLRHAGFFAKADWLWDRVRPLYDQVVAQAGQRGLERVINGTDRILLVPAYRSVQETYEPDVWRSLMAEVRPGDIVADVGVYIGLYTVALAQRVGTTGRLIAFEPDASNYMIARQHVALNGLSERVELIKAAVGAKDGQVGFSPCGDSGHVVASPNGGGVRFVECVTLDRVFAERRLDILKVDVEGYEEMVLRGAHQLLTDPARSPRALYIEVHPYAWPGIGTSSESLLALLTELGYDTTTVEGEPVMRITNYGEVIARKNGGS